VCRAAARACTLLIALLVGRSRSLIPRAIGGASFAGAKVRRKTFSYQRVICDAAAASSSVRFRGKLLGGDVTNSRSRVRRKRYTRAKPAAFPPQLSLARPLACINRPRSTLDC